MTVEAETRISSTIQLKLWLSSDDITKFSLIFSADWLKDPHFFLRVVILIDWLSESRMSFWS